MASDRATAEIKQSETSRDEGLPRPDGRIQTAVRTKYPKAIGIEDDAPSWRSYGGTNSAVREVVLISSAVVAGVVPSKA
jgi:hypothetical protein